MKGNTKSANLVLTYVWRHTAHTWALGGIRTFQIMGIRLCIILLGSHCIALGQSVENELESIRRTYQEVNEFIKTDVAPIFKIDDNGPGGGSVYNFYSNGSRLYRVDVESAYEHGGWDNIEYYFDSLNNPVFVYLKHELLDEFGGAHEYSEERTYIFNNKIIERRQKKISTLNSAELRKFKENIASYPNTQISFKYSDEPKNAVRLRDIWKLFLKY